jgi:hypothetical protein
MNKRQAKKALNSVIVALRTIKLTKDEHDRIDDARVRLLDAIIHYQMQLDYDKLEALANKVEQSINKRTWATEVRALKEKHDQLKAGNGYDSSIMEPVE